MSDPTLPLIDGSYGKPRTYDLPGQCLTCGQRFNVRRCKGDKPPLSVDCPNCECTEYSWRDLNAILAQPAAPAEGLDVERLREAAQPILDRALDVFDPDDLDPESSLAMPVTLKARWVYALQAAMEANR